MIDYRNNKLSMYLKTNFENNKKSKNISYNLDNLNDSSKFNSILKKLKIEITDIWKSENIINLTSPLAIQVRFLYFQYLQKFVKQYYSSFFWKKFDELYPNQVGLKIEFEHLLLT